MPPTDAEVRELAGRILERPEYSAWHTQEWLRRMLGWLSSLVVTNPVLGWLILSTCVSLLVVILWHVIWTLRKGMASRLSATPTEPGASAARFVLEAHALAASGRFLDASRAMQLGTIDLLVRKGLVHLARGDANVVFRRRVRDAPLGAALRDELIGLIARLERSWFRDRNEDESLYRSWQDAYARIESA